MPAGDLARRITSRLARVDVIASTAVVEKLAAYVELLARWNEKINLTALALTPPPDAAIDRLIVEPLEAARFVRDTDRLAIDIGSGGGSPAIPLKIAKPHLRMVLIEARVRKSAFLREAARALSLDDLEVATFRFEAAAVPPHLVHAVDLVTARAIRPDAALWAGIERVTSPAGQVFWFGELVITPNTTIRELAWTDRRFLAGGSPLTVSVRS